MKKGSRRWISADQCRKSQVSSCLSADWLILPDPMAPHLWPLWTYNGSNYGYKREGQKRGRALRWSKKEIKTQRQKPPCGVGRKGAGPESGIRKEVGSLPGLWQVRRSTSLKKAAWSVVLRGISRSLSSCPRQLCSRHSTMSLAGQGPSARGTPSGSARHTLHSAPRASCCPVAWLSPDQHSPSSLQASSGPPSLICCFFPMNVCSLGS